MATLTDAQIKHMVSRFLQWKLPEGFSPDGGISFERTMNAGTPFESERRPAGTNLLDARQAKEMVRHMIDGLPAEALPSQTSGAEAVGWIGDLTLQRLKNGQEGKIYPTNPCPTAGWSMPVYLAKPASEPAGGGVDRERTDRWMRILAAAKEVGCDKVQFTIADAEALLAALSSPAEERAAFMAVCPNVESLRLSATLEPIGLALRLGVGVTLLES